MNEDKVLNSKTLVDLALLGFLAGGAATSSVLTARIKQAGGHHFTPTADFVQDRLLALLASGHVEIRDGGDEIAITPDGRLQILRLLRLEIDPAAAMLRNVCMTLKLCLLELVDEEARAEIVGTLCRVRDCRPVSSPDATLTSCPLMARYLTIEARRQAEEKRYWQDRLLEEGLLDPAH